MYQYIIPFENYFEEPQVELVGGKGYNLMKMKQCKDSIPIPSQHSFIVTTKAYELFLQQNNSYFSLEKEWVQLREMCQSKAESEMIQIVQVTCKQMRESLESMPIPSVIINEIKKVIKEDCNFSYAVRSSSVSEDAGTTSFAGQHDTFLNVPAELEFVINRLRKCWSSAFTDRSVLYALYNIENAALPKMGVVIQQMVTNPSISGIVFTADPITNDRNTILMNVSYGLGEAIVSGKVNADSYSIRKDFLEITNKTINVKKIKAIPIVNQSIGKDTIMEVEVEEGLQNKQCMSDEQILELGKIGKAIEKYYANKFQDIEFAISGEDNQIYIVQSRPITSLQKIPQYPTFYFEKKKESKWINPKEKRLMLSFNHVQVHPDPFTPFGMSILRLGPLSIILSVFGLEMKDAFNEMNGRLYVDLSSLLNFYPLRKTRAVGRVLGANADKIIGESIMKMYDDPAFVNNVKPLSLQNALSLIMTLVKLPLTIAKGIISSLFIHEPVNENLLKAGNTTVDKLMNELKEKDSVLSLMRVLPSTTRQFFASVVTVAKNIFSAFLSIKVLSTMIPKDINTGELLSGVNLITTDMDLQLAHIGRIVACSDYLQKQLQVLLNTPLIPSALVREHFQNVLKTNNDKKEEVEEFLKLWNKFMNEHGHRGSGEIDITATRFCEDCSMIIRIIINSCSRTEQHSDAIENFEKKKQEVHETIHKIQAIVKNENTIANRITFGVWGTAKAAFIVQLIHLVRNYFSVRETPKYLIIKLFTGIKLQLLKKVEESSLIRDGVFDDAKDIYWLYYEELVHICETYQREGGLDEKHLEVVREVIRERRSEYEKQKEIQAPRAVSNYGEYLDVKIKQEQARANKEKYKGQNVLVGSGVSSGVKEGRVCIVLDAKSATLKPGEVLVVRQSDPGYNPLFLNCIGLISEAGGYLTHGSVVARELNLPAVVGIDNVCNVLKQGQLVRVDGDEGIVTILE